MSNSTKATQPSALPSLSDVDLDDIELDGAPGPAALADDESGGNEG